MKYIISNKLFILCFTLSIGLFSCSSDDDSSNNTNTVNSDSVSLPDSDLGIYEGILFADPINNGDTFITLFEAEDKVYTIDFNDDVPSFTDVEFVAGPNGVFTSFEDLEERGLAIVLFFDDGGNRAITVTQEINDEPAVLFTGTMQ